MARSEWTAPILIGLLATAGAYLLVPSPEASPPAVETAPPPPPPFVLMPAADTPAGSETLLLFTQNPDRVYLREGHYEDGTFTARPAACADEPPAPGEPACPLAAQSFPFYRGATSRNPVGATFGNDGYWAARVTFLALTSDSRLAISNANATTNGRFPLTGDHAINIPPSAVWYLGNGTTPAGMFALPPAYAALFAPVRGSLIGLPEGAVASAVVDSQTIRDLFGGPLYATARLDALVQVA